MRRKFIAGNWKMNLDRKAAVALAEAVAREADKLRGVDLAVCPPACYLDAVGQAIRGTPVGAGSAERLLPAQRRLHGRNQRGHALRPGGRST